MSFFTQFGRINFPGLNNYTIKGAGLDLQQQYWEGELKQQVNAHQAVGIINGGVITLVSALQIQISKGFALFNNRQMVSWDDQIVTLATADPTNPRYDRIELAYSFVNNTADVDNDNNPVTLDKIHVATASALAGTPASSPVAPVKTSGRLSLGILHVAANQVTLGGGDIDQTEDTAKDLSYVLLGDSPYGLRFNARLGYIQVTVDGTTWAKFTESDIYDCILGSAGQVAVGTATHSTLAAAIAACPASGIIKILRGTFTSAAVHVTKRLALEGVGPGSVIDADLIVDVAGSKSMLQGFRCTGDLTLATGCDGVAGDKIWLASGKSLLVDPADAPNNDVDVIEEN